MQRRTGSYGQYEGFGADNPRGAKRVRLRRVKLLYPERLFLAVFVLMIVLVAVVGLSRGQEDLSVIDPNSSSPIQTIDRPKEESTAVRSVGRTPYAQMNRQLSAYMAALIESNPNNYRHGSLSPTDQTVKTEVDLSSYRYVVAINPAAGGSDSGVVVGDAVEKNITLAIGTALLDYLNNHSKDYYYFLTRTADNSLTDAQRLRVMEGYDPDLIITLHVNSSEEVLGGTVGAYWTGEGDSEERAKASFEIAEKLMEQSAIGLNMWWREVQYREGPLLKTDVPSVAVYLGFLTYEHDLIRLMDEERRSAAAQTMGDALIKYLDEHAPKKTRGEIQREQQAGEFFGDSGSGTGNSGDDSSGRAGNASSGNVGSDSSNSSGDSGSGNEN